MPRTRKLPVTASLSHEQALWKKGLRGIFGIDEAGRGAWAGPVSAAAVCLDPHAPNATLLEGVNDSKQLSARARADLIERIHTHALAWAVGFASNDEIDRFGIVPATCLAMRRALAQASADLPADHLLIDSIRWPERAWPYSAIVRGDQLSLSIAAASILAKVARDQYMADLDSAYPGYGFRLHKGYGTPHHRQMLTDIGASPAHRMTFSPMRQVALL